MQLTNNRSQSTSQILRLPISCAFHYIQLQGDINLGTPSLLADRVKKAKKMNFVVHFMI